MSSTDSTDSSSMATTTAGSSSPSHNNGNHITNSLSEWVSLNVGGSIFKTTKSTLSKDRESFLFRLISEDSLVSAKDETGAYLIDRDPAYFGPVLNYLRHGKLVIDKHLAEEGDIFL